MNELFAGLVRPQKPLSRERRKNYAWKELKVEVLKLIEAQPGITRPELRAATGVPAASINSVMDRLAADGSVTYVEKMTTITIPTRKVLRCYVVKEKKE